MLDFKGLKQAKRIPLCLFLVFLCNIGAVTLSMAFAEPLDVWKDESSPTYLTLNAFFYLFDGAVVLLYEICYLTRLIVFWPWSRTRKWVWILLSIPSLYCITDIFYLADLFQKDIVPAADLSLTYSCANGLVAVFNCISHTALLLLIRSFLIQNKMSSLDELSCDIWIIILPIFTSILYFASAMIALFLPGSGCGLIWCAWTLDVLAFQMVNRSIGNILHAAKNSVRIHAAAFGPSGGSGTPSQSNSNSLTRLTSSSSRPSELRV